MLNYLLYRLHRRNCFSIKPDGLGQDALFPEGKIRLSPIGGEAWQTTLDLPSQGRRIAKKHLIFLKK